MIAQHEDLLLYLVNDEGLVCLLTVLKDMRYYIVPVDVPCEIENTIEDLIKDRPYLRFLTVLQHALNDPAAKLVITHIKDLVFKGVYDELNFI